MGMPLAISSDTTNQEIPDTVLACVERLFHKLIRQRNPRLPEEFAMPSLRESLGKSQDEDEWFPVPGMYGGFAYHFERFGENPLFVTSSWSRICGGSGQKHEITKDECVLVDEGFV
eukprot:CAMPEP_0184655880 /NCGR_PEP_ID=MMETSP0308-20130426/14759_1 /TAXON_ID=38269 /ORGANISM="Gloeochaete witrockiana, Strain SAG 46.84" /LENGTH=115 /DNA_ID=CAMNT_0027092681 /DNA_START=48 /DNA_END=395 /DNA_ORIENTATION=+